MLSRPSLFRLSLLAAAGLLTALAPGRQEASPSAVASGDAEQAPTRLALVVGIDTYAPGTRSFPPLKGCVRDAERVRDVLVDRFEFAPENVLLLLNEEATVEGIVRAFDRHLIRRAGPQSEVVFWFSGHGSRVPDASGREVAGLDSSLVAWDSRSSGHDGSYDLSDDLVAALRRRLCEKTERVTLVTDACHSGGGTRGVSSRTRAASAGSEPVDLELFASFWPKGAPVIEDGAPERDAARGYVHIAACTPKQRAQELDLEDGSSHGALTFFLTRSLIEAQPGMSYAALARDVAVRLATRVPGQTLCYEGKLDRTLFGAGFAARPPGHAARVLRNDKLNISAGAMLGLRKGSRLSILDEIADEELGTAVIVRTNSYSSLAAWEEEPATRPEGALRAVELSHPAGQDPLPLAVAPPELAERINSSPLVEACDGARADAYRVELVDGSVTLLAPDGVRIWSEPEAHAAEAWDKDRLRRAARSLLAEVRDELTYRSLLSLSLDGGAIAVEARFVEPNDAELELWSSYPDAGIQRVREAAWNSAGSVFRAAELPHDPEDSALGVLEVRNTTDQELYIAIVSVMEDRSRYLVWPHQGRQELLRPGRALRAPIGIQASQNWNQQRAMRDRYLVFATTRFADFSALDRNAPQLRGNDAAALPELIGNALRGPVTRGAPRVDAQPADWGVVTVDLLIDPRSASAR